jgi:hypothetical protein
LKESKVTENYIDIDQLQSFALSHPMELAELASGMARFNGIVSQAANLANIAKTDPDGFKAALKASPKGASVSDIVAKHREQIPSPDIVTIDLSAPVMASGNVSAIVDEINKACSNGAHVK